MGEGFPVVGFGFEEGEDEVGEGSVDAAFGG